MNTSNWSPNNGANCGVCDSAMESGDWKAQLQRKTIVNKIVDTMKRNLPLSGYKRLQELKKIAERVEEEIHTAATSQSEYSRKICFMMLTMETRLQSPMPDPLLSNSAALYNSENPSLPLDSTAHIGIPNGGDWQEEVYQKIKAIKNLYLLDSTAQMGNPNGDDWQEEMYQKINAMKDMYLPDLNQMHQKIISRMQQHDSLPQQLENEQLEKLKRFKIMLERFMQFLQIPKRGILASYIDKLPTYERQLINVVNSYRRKPAAPQQEAQA